MKTWLLSLLLPLLCVSWSPAQAQSLDSILIKVPEGTKPVLKQDETGKWILEVVSISGDPSKPAVGPPEATKASDTKTGEQKPKTRDDLLDAKLKGLDWETPVPASPAFVALGISPENVATPQTRRELALSLLNGSDRQGHIQTGFAVDFSPYAVFGPEVSHNEYQSNWLQRAAYNTTISLGATKAAEDGDAQRVALGLSIRLWNREEEVIGEAVKPLIDRFEERVVGDPRIPGDQARADAANAARETRLDAELTQLLKQLRAQTWGRGTASVAWAPTWLSESGKWSDLRYDGSIAWFGASWQLNTADDIDLARSDPRFAGPHRFWHLLTQVQFREGESVQGDDEKNYRQDSLLAAARLRYGTERLNGSAELGYLRTWDGPHGDGDALRYGLAVEQRVSENTWLVISAGHDMGISGSLPDDSFMVGGLRFGTRKEPKIYIKDAGKTATSPQ